MALIDETRCCDDDRAWVRWAVQTVNADANRSADTHLVPFRFERDFGVDLYLKDESTHPTGSLKHRLARSLFLYALCNGWITKESVVVEASSGSTAVSEAYFAQLLGLRFVAVMTCGTSRAKIDLIERYGGQCEFVDRADEVYARAEAIAGETGGHYIDQFTYAERATDWRGNNNIAESIFAQLSLERHPEPSWIVIGAGTGGTSATIGRYLRYTGAATKLCVVDPENSAFFHGWRDQDPDFTTGTGSRIEGIGRPRMEPSFQPDIVDRMICVPDAASLAAAHLLRERTGIWAGGSTGTNLNGALQLASEMRAAGERGSIVTLVCDDGSRYESTYYDSGWLARSGLDLTSHRDRLERAFRAGEWSPAPPHTQDSVVPSPQSSPRSSK